MKLFVSLALAVVCFVLAVLYFTGHGPAASPHKIHVTHGIVFVLLGFLSLVLASFSKRRYRRAGLTFTSLLSRLPDEL